MSERGIHYGGFFSGHSTVAPTVAIIKVPQFSRRSFYVYSCKKDVRYQRKGRWINKEGTPTGMLWGPLDVLLQRYLVVQSRNIAGGWILYAPRGATALHQTGRVRQNGGRAGGGIQHMHVNWAWRLCIWNGIVTTRGKAKLVFCCPPRDRAVVYGDCTGSRSRYATNMTARG